MYFERNKALFDFSAPYPSMHPYELSNGLRAANTINASGPLLDSSCSCVPRPFAVHLEGIRLLQERHQRFAPSTNGLIAELFTQLPADESMARALTSDK